jgi:IS6 family transposase
LVAEKRDLVVTRRFVTRALGQAPQPSEVTTDRAPVYPRVADELLPAARYVIER